MPFLNGLISDNDALTSLGNLILFSCWELATVTIDSNTLLASIGNYAFSDTAKNTTTSTYSITNCPALTTLSASAFTAYTDSSSYPYYYGESSKVQQVKLTNCSALEEIGVRTFYGCDNLASIDLTGCSSIANINSSAFYGCTELTSITFVPCKTALKTIEASAFENCTKLATVDFTDCTILTDIKQQAFYKSGITAANLATCTTLARIEIAAFQYCDKLQLIDLPGSLINIGDVAFANTGLNTSGSVVKLHHTIAPAGITVTEWTFFAMHSTPTEPAKIYFSGGDSSPFAAWWNGYTNWTKPYSGSYDPL
ncbi:hypothetical protein AGMMS49944_26520 [Spirochaetia bacterium]|nr:hypothetical protein AGMMS49944_26520 [Spirochaetia bacterium]